MTNVVMVALYKDNHFVRASHLFVFFPSFSGNGYHIICIYIYYNNMDIVVPKNM
jgi:hypothetical protein